MYMYVCVHILYMCTIIGSYIHRSRVANNARERFTEGMLSERGDSWEDIVCSVAVLGGRRQGRDGVLCAWSKDVIH